MMTFWNVIWRMVPSHRVHSHRPSGSYSATTGRLDEVEMAHRVNFSNWPGLNPGVEGAPRKKRWASASTSFRLLLVLVVVVVESEELILSLNTWSEECIILVLEVERDAMSENAVETTCWVRRLDARRGENEETSRILVEVMRQPRRKKNSNLQQHCHWHDIIILLCVRLLLRMECRARVNKGAGPIECHRCLQRRDQSCMCAGWENEAYRILGRGGVPKTILGSCGRFLCLLFHNFSTVVGIKRALSTRRYESAHYNPINYTENSDIMRELLLQKCWAQGHTNSAVEMPKRI